MVAMSWKPTQRQRSRSLTLLCMMAP
jgi:hypothetical protein